MENPLEQTLNIHFMDGSTVNISYPTQTADRYQRKLMIDELSKKRMLIFDGDGGISRRIEDYQKRYQTL